MKVLTFVLALAVLIGLTFVIPGPTDHGTVAHSIAVHQDDTEVERCHGSARTFRCWVMDGPSSSGNRYEISLDGSCWAAERIGGPASESRPLPKTLDGCVTLADWLRPLSRVFRAITGGWS